MKQGDIHCDKIVAGTVGRETEGEEAENNPEDAVLAAAEAAEIAAENGIDAEVEAENVEEEEQASYEMESTDVYEMMLEPAEEQVLIIDASSNVRY